MKKVRLLLNIVFLIFFISLIINTEINWKLIFEINFSLFLFIFCLKIISLILNAIFNKILLEAYDVDLNYYDAFYIATIAFLGNFYLPAKTGGALRLLYLSKNFNMKSDQLVSSNILFFTVGMFLNSTISIFWLFINKKQIEEYFLFSVIIFSLISILCFTLLNVRFKVHKKIMVKSNKFSVMIVEYINSLKESWNIFFSDKGRMNKLMLVYILIYSVFLLEIFIILQSLDLFINISSVGLYNSVSGFAHLIGITPSNLGVKESLLILFNNLILIDTNNLLNVSILERLITVVYTIIPLIFIFWLNRSSKLNN
tara:strand:- start:3206 stop:4144 length:939 start_codon:yes stop_codon:yes gene_type:complete